jgi:hypothetical protein
VYMDTKVLQLDTLEQHSMRFALYNSLQIRRAKCVVTGGGAKSSKSIIYSNLAKARYKHDRDTPWTSYTPCDCECSAGGGGDEEPGLCSCLPSCESGHVTA